MSTNGKLPAHALTTVQGAITLATATATAWLALEQDVRHQTGIDLVISPNGGYRSYDLQQKLSGKGHHQYRPGTSVHGWGNCVDISNYARVGIARLDPIAARYGFRRTIASEPWHYQHDGTVPAGDIEGDDDMTPEQLESIKDAVRREERYRLYRNSATGQRIGINWDLPTGDPRQILYIKNDVQLANLRAVYQILGDQTPMELAPVPFETLLDLVDGSDSAYRP